MDAPRNVTPGIMRSRYMRTMTGVKKLVWSLSCLSVACNNQKNGDGGIKVSAIQGPLSGFVRGSCDTYLHSNLAPNQNTHSTGRCRLKGGLAKNQRHKLGR